MKLSEQRLIASLILLLGFSSLLMAIYTGQLDYVLNLVKTVLEVVTAGF